MLDRELADELCIIGRELDEILQVEESAAAALDRRFAENEVAIEHLLRSVQDAKTAGQWCNTRVNAFDVLGRPRLEQAHSNFLAWLLDPAESHGLSDEFLRQFMSRSVWTEPPSVIDIKVSTEFRFHDGKFDIHVQGNGWCLIVENKIDDYPWPAQRAKYQDYCDRLKGQQAWLVYVTPSVRPSSGNWISYREVRQILEGILELAAARPSAAAFGIIEQFCDHILSDLET